MSLLEGAWAGEQGSEVGSKGTGIGVRRGALMRLGGRGTASAFQTTAASPREVLRSGALCWDGGMGSVAPRRISGCWVRIKRPR